MSSDVLTKMPDISGIGSLQNNVPPNGDGVGKSRSRQSLLPTATVNGFGSSTGSNSKPQKVTGSLIPRFGAGVGAVTAGNTAGFAPRVPKKNESTSEYIKRSLKQLDSQEKSIKNSSSYSSPPAATSGTTAPPATAIPASAAASLVRSFSSSASPPVSPIASEPAAMYSPLGVMTTAAAEALEAEASAGAIAEMGLSSASSTPPRRHGNSNQQGMDAPPVYVADVEQSPPSTPPQPRHQQDISNSDDGDGNNTPSLSMVLNNNYLHQTDIPSSSTSTTTATASHSAATRSSTHIYGNGGDGQGAVRRGGTFLTPNSHAKGYLSLASLQPGAVHVDLHGRQRVSTTLYEELKMHYQQLEANNQLLVLQNSELEQQCSSHIESIMELENARDVLQLNAERDQELLETGSSDAQYLKNQLQFKIQTIAEMEQDLKGSLAKNKVLMLEMDRLAEAAERREAEMAMERAAMESAVAQAQAAAASAASAAAVVSIEAHVNDDDKNNNDNHNSNNNEPSEQMVELERLYSTLDLQYKRLKHQYNTLSEQNETCLKQIEEFDSDNQALSTENIALQEQLDNIKEQLQYHVELAAHAKEEAVTAAAAAAAATVAVTSDGVCSIDNSAYVRELQTSLAEKELALQELNIKTNDLYDSYEHEISEIRLQNARKLTTFMILQRHRDAFGTRRALYGVRPVTPRDGSAAASGDGGSVAMTVSTCWLKWKLMVVEAQREDVNVKVTALEEFINHSLTALQAQAAETQQQQQQPFSSNSNSSPIAPGRGTPGKTSFVCAQCNRCMTPSDVCEAIAGRHTPVKALKNNSALSAETLMLSPSSPVQFKPVTVTVSTGVNTDFFPMPAATPANNRDRTSSSSSSVSASCGDIADLDLLHFLPLSPEIDRATLPLETGASKNGLRHRDVGGSAQKQDPFGHKYGSIAGKGQQQGLGLQLEAAEHDSQGGQQRQRQQQRQLRPAQQTLEETTSMEDYVFLIVIKIIAMCLLLLITYYVLDSTAQSTDSSENYYNKLVETCVIRESEAVEPIYDTFAQFSPIFTVLSDNASDLWREAVSHFQSPPVGDMSALPASDINVGAVVTSIIVELDKLLVLCWKVTVILFVSGSCFLYNYVQVHLRMTS